jgi:hypothetical protein
MARGYRVEVSGVLQVIGTLTRFGQRSGDLKDAFKRIGDKVKRDAIPLTPTQTGALANSIRSGNSKMKASVRAGGASRRSHGGGVYASIATYGSYTHSGKGPRPFLQTAARQNTDYAQEQIENEIESIIRRMGLNA